MTKTASVRRAVALVLLTLCVAAWLALGASFLFDAPRAFKIGAVIAAALATEGALWGGAVLLGWTAFANRASLLRRFTGGSA